MSICSNISDGGALLTCAGEVARSVGALALFLEPSSCFFLPFLAAFLLAGLVIYLRSSPRRQPRSWREAVRFLFPGTIWRHVSTRLDIVVYAINLTVIPVATIAVFLVSGPSVQAAFVRLLGPPPLLLPSGLPGSFIQFSIIALVTGFAEYFQHYLLHRVPALWALHRAHHSAEVLNLFTQFRFHPLEVAFSALVVGSAGGLALGAVAYFSAGQLSQGAIWLWIALEILKNLAQNFRHSHIWISYGPWLDHIFISPSMHQIHHSIRPQHLGKNLGQVLTLWDHLFGTLYVPRGKEDLQLGVSAIERGNENPHKSVRSFYVEPVIQLFRALAGNRLR
ncbi:MAG: sterol desaturase family protein [Pseudomonadota bacterium]|nr:sterol desaturase family protein [Pseudomonadota bacterium]